MKCDEYLKTIMSDAKLLVYFKKKPTSKRLKCQITKMNV